MRQKPSFFYSFKTEVVSGGPINPYAKRPNVSVKFEADSFPFTIRRTISTAITQTDGQTYSLIVFESFFWRNTIREWLMFSSLWATKNSVIDF